MVPSRPRRTRVRRALPILSLLVLVPLASLTLGPVLSAQRLTQPISPQPTSRTGIVREEPDIINVPAPSQEIPSVGPISQRPRQPNGPSATAAVRIALRARLEKIRAKYAMPGVSVTIIFPDGTSWIGVSGLADVGADRPVTPDTAFALASLTKTFTSALIMALVEDGKVGLDSQVRTYLPGLRVDPKVTVRQLLDHTSGLRDFFFHPAIDRILLAQPDRRWTEAESLKYAERPYFKPGRGWHYSNTNYLVLGMIAERVGRASLADQLRARFFDPLGLDRTFSQPTEVARGPVAHGYRFKTAAVDSPPVDLTADGPIVPFASVVTAAGGAGALAATSSDVARWARALYGGGVLDAESVQEMVDDVAVTERYRPSVPYGLGMQLLEIAGQPSLGHSGRLLGFRSAVRYLPDNGITIAVLTNQSRTDPGIIVRALLKIALQPSRDCACTDRR
ncbi:MAG: serine hydrolase domain-containing protein [Candidatus Limnocylindrales bacterium]